MNSNKITELLLQDKFIRSMFEGVFQLIRMYLKYPALIVINPKSYEKGHLVVITSISVKKVIISNICIIYYMVKP